MTREIKFRAWDNANNEWLNKEDADCLTIYLDGRYEIDRGWVRVLPDLILEQYTGLKDKNSKEIYEGDIVKRVEDGGFDIVGAVEWSEKAARFWVKRYYYPNGKKWEVIGNIHENPELLK